MTRSTFAAALLALLVAVGSSAIAAEKPPPNVLLIVLDDQNTFAGRTDLAPEPVSPNLNRLADRSVTFANAQCVAPVCNPSRTAFLSGLRPSTTGIYDNAQDSTPTGHILTRTKALPTYFHDHGYIAAGGGKIFGSSFGSVLKGRTWDESPDRKARGEYKHDPRPANVPVNGFGKHDWAPSPVGRDQLEDWRLAGWAAEFLAKPQPKPFFLAVGIVKPHTPWYVPKEYFELFPHATVTIPDLAADEYAGVPVSQRDKIPKITAAIGGAAEGTGGGVPRGVAVCGRLPRPRSRGARQGAAPRQHRRRGLRRQRLRVRRKVPLVQGVAAGGIGPRAAHDRGAGVREGADLVARGESARPLPDAARTGQPAGEAGQRGREPRAAAEGPRSGVGPRGHYDQGLQEPRSADEALALHSLCGRGRGTLRPRPRPA